jgi:hypothetical protein
MTEPISSTLLEQLAAEASARRPELFAVYGVDHAERPFLGWGMELSDGQTVYHDPEAGVTWLTATAGHIVARRSSAGTARLLWLEP